MTHIAEDLSIDVMCVVRVIQPRKRYKTMFGEHTRFHTFCVKFVQLAANCLNLGPRSKITIKYSIERGYVASVVSSVQTNTLLIHIRKFTRNTSIKSCLVHFVLPN